MKKTIILLAIVTIVGTGSYVVFAQEHMGGMMGGKDMMAQKGMMSGKMMGMPPMSAMMCNSSLVAMNDGGVVVLIGNKLTKYDNNLNVIKEVEVKIDKEYWQNMMQQHQKMMGSQSESN